MLVKKILSFSLAMIMVVALGSVIAVQADTPDYEDCTITFAWWGGDTRHEATLQAVNAFMEKYPGINVEVDYGEWSDREPARTLESISENAADVNQISTSEINEYDSNADVFMDLNEFSDIIDLTQWDPASLDMMKDADGRQFGLPVSMTGRIFYWDKTTFEEAGIEVPVSLAELREAGKVFQEKLGDDYYPLVLFGFDRMILMTFYLQAKYGKAIIADGKVQMTEEELKDGLDFIMSLEEDHVIPSFETMEGDASSSIYENPKFINGQYAGILEWDTTPKKYINSLEKGRELVVGEEFTDFSDTGNTGVFTKISCGLTISSASEHPKESAMLIQYLLNDPEGAAIMGSERGIPESKAAYSVLEETGNFDPVIEEAHLKVMAASEYLEESAFESNALKGAEGIYNYVFSGISNGEFDTEEGARMLYSAMAEALD